MFNNHTSRLIQSIGWLVVSALFVLHGCAKEKNLAAQTRLDQSRAVVESFGGQLQSALIAAMKEGGPVSAIDVCKVQAPRIAQNLSKDIGATVARTSLRTRNPNNAPNSWQQQVLRSFEAKAQNNLPLEEYYGVMGDGEARYMQAISVKPLCLACHSKELSQEVQSALEKNYPTDLAIGYDIGDVRGAFSVIWPSLKME